MAVTSSTHWSAGEIIITIIGSLFLLQLLSLLGTQIFGWEVFKGGSILLFAIYAAAVVGILNIFLRKDVSLDGKVIWPIVGLIGVVIAIHFAFPAIVPTIFEESVLSLQSTLGLEGLSSIQATVQSVLGL